MSRTTDIVIERQQQINELLKALEKAREEDIVWIVNQLQDLGYQFSFPKLEETEPF